jgi:hypothetical protein
MVSGSHGLSPHNFCGAGKPATVTGTIEGDTLVVTTANLEG